MLPKQNRLTRSEVEEVFKSGQFIKSGSLNFKFSIRSGNVSPKISMVVPKKVTKTAVKRNSLRRLGYNLVKNHLPHLPKGLQGVFVFNQGEKSKEILEDDVQKIFNKLN